MHRTFHKIVPMDWGQPREGLEEGACLRLGSSASAAEQASAGLDRLTPDEFQRFHALNAAYRDRFGFPFIICVRLTDKAGILAAMERRLSHERDAEIATALEQIGEIVRLRLKDMAA